MYTVCIILYCIYSIVPTLGIGMYLHTVQYGTVQYMPDLHFPDNSHLQPQQQGNRKVQVGGHACTQYCMYEMCQTGYLHYLQYLHSTILYSPYCTYIHTSAGQVRVEERSWTVHVHTYLIHTVSRKRFVRTRRRLRKKWASPPPHHPTLP